MPEMHSAPRRSTATPFRSYHHQSFHAKGTTRWLGTVRTRSRHSKSTLLLLLVLVAAIAAVTASSASPDNLPLREESDLRWAGPDRSAWSRATAGVRTTTGLGNVAKATVSVDLSWRGVGASNRVRRSHCGGGNSRDGGMEMIPRFGSHTESRNDRDVVRDRSARSVRGLRGVRRSNRLHGSAEYSRKIHGSFDWPWPVNRLLQQQQGKNGSATSESVGGARAGTTGAGTGSVAAPTTTASPNTASPIKASSQNKVASQGKPSSSPTSPASSPRPSSTVASGSCVRPSSVREWQQLVRGLKPTAVVAKDGTGNYRTVQAAVNAAKEGAVIYIKAGRYEEQVRVTVRRLTLLGDGPSRTILSFNRSQGGHGASLIDSAVLGVQKSGFVAMGIAVENTAGVAGLQAVALLVNADRSAFYQCRFSGYQDTLYAWGKRQYFLNCTIEGSVDFIFGNAAAVFDRCILRVRKGRNQSYIAASGRALANDTDGFVFIDCRVETAGATNVALARPWGMCARTVYIRTYLDSCIMTDGWMAWHYRINSRTPYFAEYQTYGPGAQPKLRASWVQPGLVSATVASRFLPQSFIDLNTWVGGTGLPCTYSYRL